MTDHMLKGADSELPGWQPKETASQLPKQGRLLHQRHYAQKPWGGHPY